jgi:acetylornithine/succinyldiaminopimelate/putrescine aminotransferase/predicted amino acid dehydrogenase
MPISSAQEAGREAFAAYLRPELATLLAANGMDVIYTRGQGDYLYYHDADGRERAVLDMLGGFGATLFGHNHPRLVRVATDLLESGRPFASQASVRMYAGLLAQRLSQMVGRTTGRQYLTTLANSGAEAVEAALKHAEYERHERINAFLDQLRRTLRAIRTELRSGAIAEPVELRERIARLLGIAEIVDLDDLERQLIQHNQRVFEANKRYLVLTGAFHGKTTGALKLTHNLEYRMPWYGVGLQAQFITPEDESSLQHALDQAAVTCYGLTLEDDGAIHLESQRWSQIVACLVEPIQGEGGIHELSAPFLRALRAAADESHFPLVLDEIQSGMGRTGDFLASAASGVRGDYYLFSKSLGGGLAKVAALLVDRERAIERFGYLHTSTFADDDSSCAIALAALDLLEADEGALMRGCAEKGAYLIGRLRDLQARFPQTIKDIRGRGLMIGIEFHSLRDSASALLRVVAEQDLLGFLLSGYLLNVHGIRVAPTLSAQSTVRIEPSAYVIPDDLDLLCRGLERAVELIARADAHGLVSFLIGRQSEGDGAKTHAEAQPSPPPAHVPALAGRRVGFIAHFIHAADLLHWDPSLGPLTPDECSDLLERFSDIADPFVIGNQIIHSAQGERVNLTIVALPLTAAQVVTRLRDGRAEQVGRMIEQAVELAKRLGCTQIGFGGYTSIATNNCLDFIEDRVGLTSGNSLTAAAALEATHLAMQRLGIAGQPVRLGIVGGVGNIGRVLAEVESDTVDALVLIGRGGARRRLVQLAERIYARAWERMCSGQTQGGIARALIHAGITRQMMSAERDVGAQLFAYFADHPAAPITIAEELAALRECNVIISATNAPEPIIGSEHIGLQPVVICDVSVPADVRPDLHADRPQAWVIKGGIIRLPLSQDITIAGMNLPNGQFYACLSELVVLGLAGIQSHFSYGLIQPERVRQIIQLAKQHGFSIVINADERNA